MLTLVKVQCPHCGISGQIMMPSASTLVIGPCPECHHMVAIFAGAALPLDDNIMNNAPIKEKQEHLVQVLNLYVKDKVRQCFSQAGEAPHDSSEEITPGPSAEHKGPITDSDLLTFVQHGIHQLDDPDFFNQFFV